MKNQILASLMGLLLLCLPAAQTNAQSTLIDVVCMETATLGEFCVRLFPADAPQNVANFLKYVNDGDYNNTIIHRSVSGFVVQGGGFTYVTGQGPVEVPKDAPVVNEFKRSNVRYTLAMAKSEGNPNSATSEWFINLADNSANLDNQNGGFTVFAEVVTGFSVVDAIARQPTFDISNVLGGAFGSVPLLDFDSTIVATDFITITRAFQTQRDPSAPTTSDPFPNVTTTVTYNAAAFFSAVKWTDGNLYQMLFLHQTDQAPPAYVFKVETTRILLLNDKGQDRATFDGTYLTIPSVKIPGGIITDARLELIDRRTLTFSLVSFNRYEGGPPLQP
jgi:peptidyl-prolyl cis-trans isomerase A (cyclophilin A)